MQKRNFKSIAYFRPVNYCRKMIQNQIIININNCFNAEHSFKVPLFTMNGQIKKEREREKGQ